MAMEERIARALARDRLIDMTTIGRKTKQPRRIEILFHNVDGRIYITGLPGRRSWYANLLANPAFTFHLKQSTRANLAATATPVIDQARRQEVLSKILRKLGSIRELEAWMEQSPLVEVILEPPARAKSV
jgi:deazaflavin-dependent oxidoreductase (nitroreductase family)